MSEEVSFLDSVRQSIAKDEHKDQITYKIGRYLGNALIVAGVVLCVAGVVMFLGGI